MCSCNFSMRNSVMLLQYRASPWTIWICTAHNFENYQLQKQHVAKICIHILIWTMGFFAQCDCYFSWNQKLCCSRTCCKFICYFILCVYSTLCIIVQCSLFFIRRDYPLTVDFKGFSAQSNKRQWISSGLYIQKYT